VKGHPRVATLCEGTCRLQQKTAGAGFLGIRGKGSRSSFRGKKGTDDPWIRGRGGNTPITLEARNSLIQSAGKVKRDRTNQNLAFLARRKKRPLSGPKRAKSQMELLRKADNGADKKNVVTSLKRKIKRGLTRGSILARPTGYHCGRSKRETGWTNEFEPLWGIVTGSRGGGWKVLERLGKTVIIRGPREVPGRSDLDMSRWVEKGKKRSIKSLWGTKKKKSERAIQRPNPWGGGAKRGV